MRLKMLLKFLVNRYRRIWESIYFAFIRPDTGLTFWVVSAQYNSKEATLKCLDSVYNQSLPRNRVKHIFIDDASTDNTPDLIESWLKTHPGHNVEYIRNEKNMNIAYNLHTAFKRAPRNSISMQLDGDDWLADSTALEFLTKVYSRKDIWATYNTWVSANRKIIGQTRKFRHKVIDSNSFRCAPWNAGHLKSFRSELYQHVPESYMIDPETGYWWSSAADQAFFLCILELAGKHLQHLNRILYMYNIREHTQITDYVEEQEYCRQEIRKLPPLKPLESCRLDYFK